MSCIMKVNNRGEVVSYNITPSVIRSRIQMTYNKVNDILDKNIIDPQYTDYADDLKLMRKLSDIIRKKMKNTKQPQKETIRTQKQKKKQKNNIEAEK